MPKIQKILFLPIPLILLGCILFVLGLNALGYLIFYYPPIEMNKLVTSLEGYITLLILIIGLSLVGIGISLVSLALRWPLSKWRPPSFKILLYKHVLILVIASNILAFIPLAQGRVEIRGTMFPDYRDYRMEDSKNTPHPNDKPSSLADTILKITVMGIYDAEMSHTASAKVSIRYITILFLLSILLIILLNYKQQQYLGRN